MPMSYRRLSRKRVGAEQKVRHEYHHSQSDKFYMPNVDDFARGITPAVKQELNLSKNDWPDGIQIGWKVTEPRVSIENYLYDVPLDKRTICATCKNANEPKDLKNGFYQVWCRLGFAQGEVGWKQEPKTVKDNHCRDWQPKSQDCVG